MSLLTEEQKQAVVGWIEQEADLNEVQKRLREEFGIGLTYLETRLLLDDLKVVIKDKEPEVDSKAATDAIAEDVALEPDQASSPGGGGKVSVTIDQITKPNAVISGKVTFSDGKRGEWLLDSMGRLALNPETPGYRPSQNDIMDFQMELQRIARF